MEELKILVGLVKDLPTMVVWLVVCYFFVQTVVIGSVYGIFRLAIIKLHDYLVTPEQKLVDVTLQVQDLVISSELDYLISTFSRIKSRTSITKGCNKYIHSQDIDWLNDAISEKLKRDVD